VEQGARRRTIPIARIFSCATERLKREDNVRMVNILMREKMTVTINVLQVAWILVQFRSAGRIVDAMRTCLREWILKTVQFVKYAEVGS
jgi:hypothetical protein